MPIVLHVHSNWLVQLDRYLLEPRLADADAIVGNSEYVTEAIRKRLPNRALRCDAVFNGVDIDAFYLQPTTPSARRETSLYMFGRSSPAKGVHDLLDAFEKVLAVRPSTRLELIGGPYLVPIDELMTQR